MGIDDEFCQHQIADAIEMNAFIRQRAVAHAIAHIDVWDAFSDGQGRYTDFGYSASGDIHRQRHIDGIHFAAWGRKRLAELVLRSIDTPPKPAKAGPKF